MKRIKHVITGIVLLVLTSTIPLFAEEGIHFEELTLEQALSKAKKEHKKIFIDIYATWCGPCKYLTKYVFIDQDLGEYMNKNFVCLKLDGEKPEGMQLMVKHGLNSFPSLLFLSSDNILEKKIVGAETAEQIKTKASYVIDPTLNPIFNLRKQYDEGTRDRKSVKTLIIKMLEGGEDPSELINDFVATHESLDLDDEEEFVIFVIGIDDLQNQNSTKFLAQADKYYKMYGAICQNKMELILNQIINTAVEKKDKTLISTTIELVYPAYAIYFGEASHSKSELIKVLEEAYENSI